MDRGSTPDDAFPKGDRIGDSSSKTDVLSKRATTSRVKSNNRDTEEPKPTTRERSEAAQQAHPCGEVVKKIQDGTTKAVVCGER
jgi:hypothetical protein